MAWPAIATPSGITQTLQKSHITTRSEAGYSQSRSSSTLTKRLFSLTWDDLSSADLVLLEAHYIATLGSSFTWAHPLTSTEYTVLYIDDTLESAYRPYNLWNVTLKLQEV